MAPNLMFFPEIVHVFLQLQQKSLILAIEKEMKHTFGYVGIQRLTNIYWLFGKWGMHYSPNPLTNAIWPIAESTTIDFVVTYPSQNFPDLKVSRENNLGSGPMNDTCGENVSNFM